MPDLAHLTAFAIAAITIALIPGPGMIYVLARSLGGGREEGLRSTAGTGIGGLVHVAAAAAGLSAIIATSATAFSVVKYIGAAYLVWLGLRAILDRSDAPTVSPGNASRTDAFRQGILTEVFNPKTALFFLTFLPQFCQPENGPVGVQVLALGAISVALNTLMDVVVAVGAGRISQRLRERPAAWRRQQVATGSILIGLGAYAALGSHRASK